MRAVTYWHYKSKMVKLYTSYGPFTLPSVGVHQRIYALPLELQRSLVTTTPIHGDAAAAFCWALSQGDVDLAHSLHTTFNMTLHDIRSGGAKALVQCPAHLLLPVLKYLGEDFKPTTYLKHLNSQLKDRYEQNGGSYYDSMRSGVNGDGIATLEFLVPRICVYLAKVADLDVFEYLQKTLTTKKFFDCAHSPGAFYDFSISADDGFRYQAGERPELISYLRQQGWEWACLKDTALVACAATGDVARMRSMFTCTCNKCVQEGATSDYHKLTLFWSNDTRFSDSDAERVFAQAMQAAANFPDMVACLKELQATKAFKCM